MSSFSRNFAVIIMVGLAIPTVQASVATCQSAQFKMAAGLCQKLLTCESRSAGAPRWNSTPCLSKAVSGAAAEYGRAVQAEQSKGGQCKQAADANSVITGLRDGVVGTAGISGKFLQGWNGADKANNRLYATLLKSGATACSELITAFRSNVIKPNSGKLKASLRKAHSKFTRAASKNINNARRRGQKYAGAEPDALANAIRVYADGVVAGFNSDSNNPFPLNHAPTGSIAIGGNAQQGQTLTVDTSALADADGLGILSYQWKADGTAIVGAYLASYRLSAAEAGKAITVTVSFTDGHGTPESVTSPATALVSASAFDNHTPTGSVTISGAPLANKILLANTSSLADADGLGPFSYQWKSDGAAIPGATANSYTVAATDMSKALSVSVSYVDGQGNAESISSPPVRTLSAPVPGVALSGQRLNFSVYQAIVPPGMTVTEAPNVAVSLARTGCFINMYAPVAATGDLDAQALQLLSAFAGSSGYGIVGIVSASPLEDYFHKRGVTADGWPYVDLTAELSYVGGSGLTVRSGQHVRILAVQLGNQVAPMLGWQDSYYAQNKSPACIHEEVLDPFEWSRIFYTLSFPGHQAANPNLLRDQLVGGWFGTHLGQVLSIGWEDVYSGNGRYSDLIGLEEWRRLNSMEILDTFSTWQGAGYWMAYGNLLTIWPDDPAKPPKTVYFRIWDEYNTAEPSGWRRTIRKLGTCGNDNHLCEGWADKE